MKINSCASCKTQVAFRSQIQHVVTEILFHITGAQETKPEEPQTEKVPSPAPAETTQEEAPAENQGNQEAEQQQQPAEEQQEPAQEAEPEAEQAAGNQEQEAAE